MDQKPAISLRGISKSFGSTIAADDLNIDVAKGEFFCLLGETSAGKTTSLRLIAGIESADAGHIYINGVNADAVPMAKRGIGMVFQGFALFPHMTTDENLRFSLDQHKMGSAEIKRRMSDIYDLLRIGHVSHKKPGQLSGGERQRVAIGRALISEPSILLLDEPLTNLDAKLRNEMRAELKRLHAETGTTVVYATPDQLEAMTMAQRIAVLKDGKVISTAKPMEHYLAPDSLDVAELIGAPAINVIKGRRGDAFVDCSLGKLECALGTDVAVGDHLRVGFYPHAVKLGPATNGDITVLGKATVVEPIGDQAVISVLTESNEHLQLVTSDRSKFSVAPGQLIAAHVSRENIHIFDAETRRRVSA